MLRLIQEKFKYGKGLQPLAVCNILLRRTAFVTPGASVILAMFHSILNIVHTTREA